VAKTGFVCQNLRVDQQAGEGPLFNFVNKTPYHADIDFLDQRLAIDQGTNSVLPRLTVDPQQTSRPLLVNVELRPGLYFYKAVLREPDLEAEGGSSPGIEIVP
jgi:hypothetical protein